MHHQQEIEAFKQNTMPYNTKTTVINIFYFNLVHFMTAEVSGYLINNLNFSSCAIVPEEGLKVTSVLLVSAVLISDY